MFISIKCGMLCGSKTLKYVNFHFYSASTTKILSFFQFGIFRDFCKTIKVFRCICNIYNVQNYLSVFTKLFISYDILCCNSNYSDNSNLNQCFILFVIKVSNLIYPECQCKGSFN